MVPKSSGIITAEEYSRKMKGLPSSKSNPFLMDEISLRNGIRGQ